jgi:hypothetical protein
MCQLLVVKFRERSQEFFVLFLQLFSKFEIISKFKKLNMCSVYLYVHFISVPPFFMLDLEQLFY